MGFKFDPEKEGTEAGVRRIALEQVGAALAQAKVLSDPEETIHSLRRRCKKLRGLLRLIKPNFKRFSDENDILRAAAAGLAGSRDAAVMIKTLGNLRKDDANLPVRAVIKALQSNKGAASPEGNARDLLREFSRQFEALQDRIPGWKLRGRGFDSLADGLQQNYQRMRHGASMAQDSNDPVEFHEWRKAAKYFWHHLSLLGTCAPAITSPYRSAAADLEALLGDHHDLTVLSDFLEGLSDPSVPAIQITLRQKRDRLGRKAIVLGRQLVAEKPGPMVDRFAQYWTLAKQGE